ncbi:fibrinogen-like protein 1 [Drosophila sulfurigaster albostrigata]|uniref:fibrinogen-like protein 1 n=1 Tax=Drosophila sulfurigaster albostrigata TaxID=89887 RepID=UPI002D21CB22|nr:fibrinogen-like protein 1 [Drosophila sulfurigaster albostrigata]
MNNIQVNIFLILLIAYKVYSSCLMASKELGDQCSLYCYQVVKPLLQYVNTTTTMTQEQNELQQTIKVQAETIKNLNELMKSKDMQLMQQNKSIQLSESHALNQQKLIDEYKMQSELNSRFYESCQRRNRNQQNLYENLSKSFKTLNQNQQKLIDQFQVQLSNLKSEIQSKDNKITKSENLNTNVSSCLRKMTGIHVITLPDAQPFIVSCESNWIEAGTGWTVIQRRKDGSVDFNRTWSEYKEGFGDLGGEFFLGLEKLHLLTQSKPHELYILLGDFKHETRYARYNNFVIGNETEFYKLEELGIYSGNAGDALSCHKNKPFSTVNKFHHSGSNPCAKKYNSGWWFYDNDDTSCSVMEGVLRKAGVHRAGTIFYDDIDIIGCYMW